MPGFFITGTDTGVGKTYVTLLLARYFIGKGIDVGIMKPVSSGPARENDAILMRRELGLKDPLEIMNPVSLKFPLAPYSAARMLKKKINLPKIFRAFKKLKKLHKIILVEGIGGILVPIKYDYFVADMIYEFYLPAIIVARAGLGTINHTLLTVEALKKRKVRIAGIILNGFSGSDLSERTNADVISRMARVPVIAKIPWKKQ